MLRVKHAEKFAKHEGQHLQLNFMQFTNNQLPLSISGFYFLFIINSIPITGKLILYGAMNICDFVIGCLKNNRILINLSITYNF